MPKNKNAGAFSVAPPKGPDIPMFDFDALQDDAEVWSDGGDSGFGLVFQKGRLHLVYTETGDIVGGAHELTDKEMMHIMHLLIQFLGWIKR